MFTRLIKAEREDCESCGRKEEGYFGNAYIRETKSKREIIIFPLCKVCFENDSAIAEADSEKRRYTNIGTGSKGIYCYNGNRCECGAVTHANLGYCIKCSIAVRMIGKIEAEKRFINKMLKELRAEIKSKLKESENAN